MQPNSDTLKKEMNNNPRLRELVDYLSHRERSREFSDAKRLARETKMLKEDVVNALYTLESLGFGRLMRSGRSRYKMQWFYNFRSIKNALGNLVDLKPAPKKRDALPKLVSISDAPANSVKEETKSVKLVVVEFGRIKISTPIEDVAEVCSSLKNVI